MSTTSPKVRHILTLDGGGVRGLSTLLIIREFMEQLQHMASSASTPPSDPLRPCDVFDLIVGTGTGGISALFLGRLHMTIDEAIDEYRRMATTVFKPASFSTRLFPRSDYLFDCNTLKDYLRETVSRYLNDPDATLFQPGNNPRCRSRVAVLAATSANIDSCPYVFRTDVETTPSFKIVDVAQATSATAGLFPAVSLSNPPITFIDAGSSGYNNPTEVTMSEAHKVWPDCSFITLSIGTGAQRIVDARGSQHGRKLEELSQRLIESCEAVHDRLFRSQNLLSYFRFNIDHGLEDVGMKEWNEAGDTGCLAGITSAYLRKGEPTRWLELCTKVVHGESETTIPDQVLEMHQ